MLWPFTWARGNYRIWEYISFIQHNKSTPIGLSPLYLKWHRPNQFGVIKLVPGVKSSQIVNSWTCTNSRHAKMLDPKEHTQNVLYSNIHTDPKHAPITYWALKVLYNLSFVFVNNKQYNFLNTCRMFTL